MIDSFCNQEPYKQRAEPRTQRSGVSGSCAGPLTPLEDSLRARLGRIRAEPRTQRSGVRGGYVR
jgi:hypothetical protein